MYPANYLNIKSPSLLPFIQTYSQKFPQLYIICLYFRPFDPIYLSNFYYIQIKHGDKLRLNDSRHNLSV